MRKVISFLCIILFINSKISANNSAPLSLECFSYVLAGTGVVMITDDCCVVILPVYGLRNSNISIAHNLLFLVLKKRFFRKRTFYHSTHQFNFYYNISPRLISIVDKNL